MEREIAAFVARVLGREVTGVERLDAWVTNAVYAVDADAWRTIAKASALHGALRAEAWACARGAEAGCGAPEVLGFGRLGGEEAASVLLMRRVAGRPAAAAHPALSEAGRRIRRLHEVRLPGFGALAEASWDARGGFTLPHGSWPVFLEGICRDARTLEADYALAAPAADAARAALADRAAELAAVEVGSLCHGDLKAAHLLVDDAGRLAGVIDWGDAAVGDPLWEIARFAHRSDAAALAALLEGYDPERALADALVWRLPLYSALWMLVDAVVAHRLGRRVDAVLEAARGVLPPT